MGEPAREIDEPSDAEAAGPLQLVPQTDAADVDAGRRIDPHAIVQGSAAVTWGAAVAWYQTVAGFQVVVSLLAAALVLAGARLLWMGVRGTARRAGAIRRWGSSAVAVAIIAACVVGVAVGGFGPDEPPARAAAPAPAPAAKQAPTAVALDVDPARVALPSRWRLDADASTPQTPVWLGPDAALEVAMVETSIAVDVQGEQDLIDAGAGFVDGVSPGYPGYELGSVTPTTDVAGMPAIAHEFSLEFDGQRVPAYQLILVDGDRGRLVVATAYPVAAEFTASTLAAVRRDVEAAFEQ